MPVPRRASPPEVRREQCTPRATSPGRAGASSALSRPMPPLAVGAIVTGERPLVLAVGHATTDGTAHEPQPDQPPAAVLRLPVQPARDRTALRPRRVESCYSIFSMPYCAYSLRPEVFWRVACCRVAACTAGRAHRYRRPGGWVRRRVVRGPPGRAADGFLCRGVPRGGSGAAAVDPAGAGPHAGLG